MQPDTTNDKDPSPFHAGEQEIQSRTGKREAMEEFGRKIIRSFMPDEHRAFFNQLPYIVVGSVDRDGWPWASIISGSPGFIESPDRKRLDINATPLPGDPLHQAWTKDAPIGLLGIELATRRRNRLNASVRAADSDGLSLTVDQSFGNCPQYIQTRPLSFVRDPASHSAQAL
ncbi:MAG: pyridoxamine 5'-phosphate oxidase family protein, partial [Pseudomonadota bacterium]